MRRMRIGKVLLAVLLLTTMSGCGKMQQGEPSGLEGSCEEILNRVYENAELDEGLREAMEDYEMKAIDASMEAYILGTEEVEYTDSVYSAPLMTGVAYQCVILRLAEGEDVEEAKRLLAENADPIKWICVEAESVVVENTGDVVLYVMADEETADAIKTAFLALDES